jgi:hypothetical protein
MCFGGSVIKVCYTLAGITIFSKMFDYIIVNTLGRVSHMICEARHRVCSTNNLE